MAQTLSASRFDTIGLADARADRKASASSRSPSRATVETATAVRGLLLALPVSLALWAPLVWVASRFL